MDAPTVPVMPPVLDCVAVRRDGNLIWVRISDLHPSDKVMLDHLGRLLRSDGAAFATVKGM